MERPGRYLITYQIDDGVAVIGLNRPDKRNAINDELIAALDGAVDLAQREAKVAIVFGHGSHFCAGLDLAEHAGRTAQEGIAASRRWHSAFARISRGPIPFLGAIAGGAIGGGFELAASMHLRIADPAAFFALPEGQRGIFVGGGGSVRITRLIGPTRMMDMMLTGRVMPAGQAEATGLVQYVSEPGQVLVRANTLARQIASNAPFSNHSIVNCIPRMLDVGVEDGLFFESYVAAVASATEEARAGLDAFLSKRSAPLRSPDPDGA